MRPFTNLYLLKHFQEFIFLSKVLQGSLLLLQFLSSQTLVCNSSKVNRCLIRRKPLGQLLMYLIKTIFTSNHL